MPLEFEKYYGTLGTPDDANRRLPLNPLDIDTIAQSVRKTGRLVTVSEGYPRCSFGEDVIRRVTEHRFENGRTGFTYLDEAFSCQSRPRTSGAVGGSG